MKKLLSLMLSVAVFAISIPGAFVSVSAEETNGQIKNIIYLIPDGGGYGLYDFANLVKEAGGFNPEKFPNKTPTEQGPMALRAQLGGSATTRSASSAVTDSAAAGTALSSGYKTVNGYVGIDKNCVPKANLVEAAESVGKATGIISTYHWSHATPAAFTAHAIDRGDDYNIYQQIENKDLEVVLGVGYGMVSQYGATIQNAVDRGYTIIENKEDLLNVKPGEKIWGNIVNETYPYDVDLSEGQPTLAEMTAGAITVLSGDPDGFFLMVEGGKVDTGGHSNDARTSTSEYLAFDAAFKVALDFAKSRTDTVVIATPDHNTGGLHIPEDPTSAVADVIEGVKPADLSWDSYSHTGDNVPVWAYVPEGVSLVEGLSPVLGDTQETRDNYVIDNTAIAPWCADFIGVDLGALTKELFVDVSRIGTYSALTRKFTFNNGDKYIYANQDEYYKDGEKISTNGKTSVYVNNTFYVPAEIVEEEDWNHVSEGGTGDGITGKGSASDPYIIDDAYDFMEFTGNLIAGNTYIGKYIRQTKDIDLTDFADYQGVGDGPTFKGVYDGHGNSIKVAITSDQDVSIFPKLSGTAQGTDKDGNTIYAGGVLMNVGTEGTIKSTKEGGYAAGIAYYVGVGGKIANSYSIAKIEATNAAGLATYNMGFIGNCAFCGGLTGTNRIPIASNRGNYAYEFLECYFLKGVGSDNLDGTLAATADQIKTKLATQLNNNRRGLAKKLGYSDSSIIVYWTNDDAGYPDLYVPTPVVTSVTVTPNSATVDKGDGILLTATVEGEYNYSKEVVWSIEGEVSEGTTVASDGFLVIDPNETAESFAVMAKSHQDGGVAGVAEITVGENTLSTPDGTRARPYIIASEEDFKALADGMIEGNDYKDLYFRQTNDLDLAGLEGYTGLGTGQTFGGFYDAAGHIINIDIVSDTDKCLFPYLTGTIINLGVTGSVKNAGIAGSVCPNVQEGGRIVNCWSSAFVEGNNPGGIASTNYGSIASCYFCGRLNAISGKVSDIAVRTEESVDRNNYYIGDEYIPNSHNSSVTAAELENEVRSGLNLGTTTMANATKLPSSMLLPWYYVDGVLSFSPEGIQHEDNAMVVDPETLTVSLSGKTSLGTIYAAMYDADGNLVDFNQYPASATVKVNFADDAEGAYVTIMWWQGLMEPICAAQTIDLSE